MRTTLVIDDDVLAAAKGLAARQSKTIGQVVTELARQALHPADNPRPTRNGITLLPIRADATPVTMEAVNRLRDEMP